MRRSSTAARFASAQTNRATTLFTAVVLAGVLAGCAPAVGVKTLTPESANRSLTANVLNTGEPSTSAYEFLYRANLASLYEKNPPSVLATLHAGLGGRDERDRLYALAELSYDHAIRKNDERYFLAAALYAWMFLFDEKLEGRPSRYDPRVRVAMDLYNRGIAEGLSARDTMDVTSRQAALPFATMDIVVDPAGLGYAGYQLQNFTSLAGLETRGFRNRYRTRGIGAPMAASVARTGDKSVDRWIGPRSKVPKTALLRFENPRAALSGGVVHAKLELLDVEKTKSVPIAGESVPLETEMTAALAYRLEGSPIWDFEIAGFRRGDLSLDTGRTDNLFMLHPYQPGQIPVVFVHGTASSPARWAEMTNELMNDPVLGSRYQYWYFLYNTGNPVAYSAAQLRKAIANAVTDIDPQGKDPALERMVVIGHSQGGLLTKLMAVSSGDRFWRNVSNVPFEQADLSKSTRELLSESIFFEPVPQVRRVVFIATPHHGAMMADHFLGNLARRLISLPATVLGVGADLIRLQASGAIKRIAVPTSLDNMKPTNPFLVTLVETPVAPGVHAHSIVPVNGVGPPEKLNDTVVTYESAHITPVDSEYIVRSKHSTQAVPETIEEVRRILYLHLEQQ